MSSAAQSGTPKWPGDHAEKHRQAALLGWARKRGFTRDTVKRGRRKSEPTPPQAPPSRGMELARQAKASAQRARPAADPGYSPHTLPVARLTLMHELSMERDAAKRAAIRRELRKLGVPSNEIPKEPRKPRAERSAAVSQPKPARIRNNEHARIDSQIGLLADRSPRAIWRAFGGTKASVYKTLRHEPLGALEELFRQLAVPLNQRPKPGASYGETRTRYARELANLLAAENRMS